MALPSLRDYDNIEDTGSIDSLIKDYFLEQKLVTEKQMLFCLKESEVTGIPIGKTLVNNNFISHELLIKSMLLISPDGLENEEIIVNHIPPELLINTKTKVAAETINDIYLATEADEDLVEMLLAQYFPTQKINFIECPVELINNYLEKLVESEGDGKKMNLEKLLRSSILLKSSDIHIEPKRLSYTVKVRILGVLEFFHEGDIEEYQILVSKIKDRSSLDLAERRKPQDGKFSFEHDGRLIDLRVATTVTVDGEKVVIRILDPMNADKRIRDLGIENIDQWLKGATNHHGINLIIGGTGSGKTTTLNATIRELDKLGKAIYTAEDPVEFKIPYIAQCNINDAVGFDYSRALKSFMRTDPDIILIGEIRDIDTARNAIKASVTGHLVFATLHTNTISEAFDRFRDIGVPAHELKSILNSVLCQTLIRTKCKGCNGKGCVKCFNTGYGGRCIVSECHYFTDKNQVEQAFRDGAQFWDSIELNAFQKLKQDITTFEELDRVFGERIHQLVRYEITRMIYEHISNDYSFKIGSFINHDDLIHKLNDMSHNWKSTYESIYSEVISDKLLANNIENEIKIRM